MPINIIRAWKDREYRNSLDEEQLAALPENPAGNVDLTDITDAELELIQGGGETDGICFTGKEYEPVSSSNCPNQPAPLPTPAPNPDGPGSIPNPAPRPQLNGIIFSVGLTPEAIELGELILITSPIGL